MSSPYRLLFVCMGNICRSPCAEGVMRTMIDKAGLSDQVKVDSAGTGGWHAGDKPDSRMRRHAALRGYTLDSEARQVRSDDFTDFDLILVMDERNLRDIAPFAPDPMALRKVRLFCDFTEGRTEREVPDPYYGGVEGFEQVLDLVENGCAQLVEHVRGERDKG